MMRCFCLKSTFTVLKLYFYAQQQSRSVDYISALQVWIKSEFSMKFEGKKSFFLIFPPSGCNQLHGYVAVEG